MMKIIAISWIPGIMFGIEWAYTQGFFVIDLGIIRITYDYEGIDLDERVTRETTGKE